MILPDERVKTPEITEPIFAAGDVHAGLLEQQLRLVVHDLINGIAKSGCGFLSGPGKVTMTYAPACLARPAGLLSSRDAIAPPSTQPAVRW